MLPNSNELVLINTRQTYLFYDGIAFNPMVSLCKGGIAIGDVSQGNTCVDWTLTYSPNYNTFIVTSSNGVTIQLGSAPIGITINNVSLAFDQNMQLCWCYNFTNSSGVTSTNFSWFNPTTTSTVTVNYPNTTMSYILLDDYRQDSSSVNDIILFYVRASDNMLCYRYQREQYQTEHAGILMQPGEQVIQVGFTTGYRVQVQTNRLTQRFHFGTLLDVASLPILDTAGNPLWLVSSIDSL